MVIKLLQKTLTSLLLLFLSFATVHGHANRAQAFVYAGCSDEKYQPNSPFEGSLNSLLASVTNSAAQSLYNAFALGNETEQAAIFGLYQCRGDLQAQHCSSCVTSAASQIALICPYSYGATLQLEGCFVRYEHFDFLGKPDIGLRHKKCGKSVGNDVEFFRRRDDVLGDLQGATSYRVSSSGLVEGFAQCLGDLSGSDCSACVAEAVGKLKSLCGSAAAAEVFLAQCYAHYWGSGYYDISSDSSNEDDVGKTVAIIVGVLAGIAVLIVLLSICRKTMS